MTQQEMPDSVSLLGLVQLRDWLQCHWRQVRTKTPVLCLNDEVSSRSDPCTRAGHLACGFTTQDMEEDNGVLLRAWNHPRAPLTWPALLQCRTWILPVDPQLSQPLLDALILDLTLYFALDLEVAIILPELSPLQIRSPSGDHTAA